jgi:hypothetical protein
VGRIEELTVLTKTYDLILWSCHHTSRFLLQHRFVLGERIERNLYDPLETLIQAKYTRERKSLLEQANLKLEILRSQVRLAKDLECASTKASATLSSFGRKELWKFKWHSCPSPYDPSMQQPPRNFIRQ